MDLTGMMDEAVFDARQAAQRMNRTYRAHVTAPLVYQPNSQRRLLKGCFR